MPVSHEGGAPFFRGRDRELGELLAKLRSARSGRMATVLVGGDAGVGKTRLVNELAAIADDERATVLIGRAIGLTDAPPFWPVISAIRNAVRAGLAGGAAELLERSLTELGPPTGADDPGPRPPIRLLELLHRVIVDLAELSSVLLVIEDLQWADRSTRELIAYLVANLSTEPVLVIGTYRGDTPEMMPGLAETLSELRRNRKVSGMQIEPLSRAALADLVADWAPERPGLEPLVWQRSAGNAFIAEETVRAVLGGDALGLPTTLRELVLSRVARLSPDARRVVRAVAVSAGPLPHPLLVDVLEPAGPALLDAVREAVELGVVVVDDHGDGYQLRHGLMAEVVAADLLPGEHIDLHRRYAVALSGGPDPEAPGISARLAHHWHEAGEPERALVATVAAAHASERIHGHAETYRHWLRAAELTTRVADQTIVVDRAECLDRAARAAELAGHHEEAVALLDTLLAGQDTPGGLPAALLTARKGGSLAAAGRGRDAVRAYQAAAALLPETGVEAERAQVLAGYGAALLQDTDFVAARSVAGAALALARAARARTVEAKVLAILGFSLAYLEDTSAGSAALAEALAVAERTGEPTAIGEALLRRAELLAGPLNQMDGGVECARRGVERMRALGLSRTAGVALLAHAANGLFRLGRWDEAQRTVAEAWALSPTGAGALEVRLARGRLDLGRGRLDAAADDLEAVELLAGPVAGPRYRIPLITLWAGLEMWRGQPDVALARVAEGLAVVQAADDIWSVAPLVWHGTRAWAETTRLGLPAPPAALVGSLRGWCAELARRGPGAVAAVREVVETFSMMCAAETARAEDRSDPGAWQRVTERWQRLQHPYPAAYARLRRAEALLSRRCRSTAAADDLVLAERIARSLGAQPLLAEILDLAGRARIPLDGPPGPAEPVPAPDPATPGELASLTARELEVLTELASGLTNREIAARLFISAKTVGVHIGRIFTKIGVHSRVQASAVLHRSRSVSGFPRLG